jgi:hypothetical protein
MRHPSPRLAGTLLLAVAVVSCGRPQLASHWRDRELVVDGNLDEWAGWQSELREAGARVAVANDGEALYLALETTDPALARLIAHRGLTLWFDPAGGDEHVLGVRYPLPSAAPASRWGALGGSRPGGAQLDKLELLGPQPYTRRELRAPGADGVQVAVGFDSGLIRYEARVPLGPGAGWGLGGAVGPGARLGVALQARGRGGPPGSRGTRRVPPGDRPGAGGEPGGDEGGEDAPPADPGGGGHGHAGGTPENGSAGWSGIQPPSRRRGAIRDFEAWAVVRLASAPAR